MSHLVTIPAQFIDLATLQHAAESLGCTFNVGNTKVEYYYTGTAQESVQELYKSAQHTITVPGTCYNVGVKRNDKGHYQVFWDPAMTPGMKITALLGKGAEKLKVAYATQHAIGFAKSKGWNYTLNTLPNGNTTVEIQTT